LGKGGDRRLRRYRVSHEKFRSQIKQEKQGYHEMHF
jgi:hypothetical protein